MTDQRNTALELPTVVRETKIHFVVYADDLKLENLLDAAMKVFDSPAFGYKEAALKSSARATINAIRNK